MSELEQLRALIDKKLVGKKKHHVLAERLIERIALQLQTAKKESPDGNNV
jgi:hypothetical protein